MEVCEEMGLDKNTYSVTIPLGATINMNGAAVTITVMTLAAANTLGIPVDIPTAIILSVLSALSACGASGVWHLQRCGHAGHRCRIYHWRGAGFRRDRPQFLLRPAALSGSPVP